MILSLCLERERERESGSFLVEKKDCASRKELRVDEEELEKGAWVF
jgi:hypothetical protein